MESWLIQKVGTEDGVIAVTITGDVVQKHLELI
jgi:hypothetical protein